MDEALVTMTAHARVLESTAKERHRSRLEQTKDDMKLALEDAIERINKALRRNKNLNGFVKHRWSLL